MVRGGRCIPSSRSTALYKPQCHLSWIDNVLGSILNTAISFMMPKSIKMMVWIVRLTSVGNPVPGYQDFHLAPMETIVGLVKNTSPCPWQASLRWDKRLCIREGFDACSETKNVTQESRLGIPHPAPGRLLLGRTSSGMLGGTLMHVQNQKCNPGINSLQSIPPFQKPFLLPSRHSKMSPCKIQNLHYFLVGTNWFKNLKTRNFFK